MSIGDRIRQRRLELGISQTKLAKLAGVSQALITKLETGKSKTGSTLKVLAFSEALGVSLQWLLSGEDAMQSDSAQPEDHAVEEKPALSQANTPNFSSKPKEVSEENYDKEMEKVLAWLRNFWNTANPEERKRFLLRFGRAFPDFLLEARYGRIQDHYGVQETSYDLYNSHDHSQQSYAPRVHEPSTPYNPQKK